jgi:hypothetical protein
MISGPTNGQILKYDSTSSKWKNANGADQDVNTSSDVTFGSVTVSTATSGTTYAAYKTSKSTEFVISTSGVASGSTTDVMTVPAGFNTIKFLVQVFDDSGSTKRVHSQEIMVIIANGNVYESEYGITYSDVSLGEFTAIRNSNETIALQYTPVSGISSASVTVTAQALKS